MMACADGAGSASHAALGAKLACLSFLHSAAETLEAGLPVREIQQKHILGWHEQARRCISLESCLRNLGLRDFACTLLTAIVGREWAVFSQIGDGAIIIPAKNGYETIFWPQTGEYVNTTFFLTDPGFEEKLAQRSVEFKVDELALLTDGLQDLALHYASRSVHAPFFDPMFKSLRQVADPEDLEEPLRQFLQSAPVNDRTDDDKTLVLASRRPSTYGCS
jgi:hypothetical protein